MSKQNKKYKFITAKPGKLLITYFKAEEELEDHEYESLYQQFAQAWDFQPMKNKNRFLQWLITEGAKIHKPELSVCPKCQEVTCECTPFTIQESASDKAASIADAKKLKAELLKKKK